jgi:hypothetical protein
VLHQLEQKTDSNWQQLFALSTLHFHAKRISKACKKQTYAFWMTASRWHTQSFSNEESFPRVNVKTHWLIKSKSIDKHLFYWMLIVSWCFIVCAVPLEKALLLPSYQLANYCLTLNAPPSKSKFQNCSETKTIPQTNKSFLNEINTAIHGLPFPFL